MKETEQPPRFTYVYHSIVAIITLLAGAAALSAGIWLNASKRGELFHLNHASGDVRSALLSVNVTAFVFGGYLILTGVASLIALGKGCVGATFRVMYLVVALILFVVLVATTAVSAVVLQRARNESLHSFLQDGWTTTAVREPEIICEIEAAFQCRGFDDEDCAECLTGLEPKCPSLNPICTPCTSNEPLRSSTGCYKHIQSILRRLFLPTAVVSAILAAVVLVDIFFLCCL